MSSTLAYSCIMLLGVLIAGISQIFLKKAAQRTYDKWIHQYLNVRVIVSYGLLIVSTLCSVVAYRVLKLSTGPIWDAAGQGFIITLSWVFLNERPNKRKMLGLFVITGGILIFVL